MSKFMPTSKVKERARNASNPRPLALDPERFSSANRRTLSSPGMRTFLAIVALWGLTEKQRRLILGLPSRSTYQNWVKTAREHRDLVLNLNVLTRISAILGIHQALGMLHRSERDAVSWLRVPHKAIVFGGRPPMELLTCGKPDGLLTVRHFLDAAQAGIYMMPNEIDTNFQPYMDADIFFT
jgi:uncharacterized protein (DUF2384 family)